MAFNLLKCQWGCCTMPMRINIGIMLLLLVIVAYTQRTCFNIAIVEMVIAPAKKKSESAQACPLPPGQKEDSISNIGGGKHDWSEREQAILLAIFYVGYIPFSYVAGIVSDKIGARWPTIVGMVISTVCTALMPFLVNHTHYIVVAASRLIAGCAQGTVYPGMSSFLGAWVPLEERATIGGVAYAGTSIGTIIGTLFTGLVVHWSKSWVVQFYMWTGVGVGFLILMGFYMYSKPKTHPFVLPEEKAYIEQTINIRDHIKVPYVKIIFDQGVWAIIFAQLGHNFVFFTMATNLPKYMHDVLRVNMKSNAFASSLPYLASYVSSVGFGKVADYWIKYKNGNVLLVRKLYIVIANIMGAVMCLVASLIGCSITGAWICFTVAQFFIGFFYCSCKINPNDLSINHASFVMAVGNGTGCLSAVVTPYIISWIAPDNSLAQWHIYFFITLSVAVVSSILYCILGKASRRKWDYLPEEYAALPTEKPKKKWYMEKAPEVFAVDKEKMLAEDAEKKKAKEEKKKKMKEDKQKEKERKQQEKEAKQKNKA